MRNVIRTDIFDDKKCVHVRISKHAHAALRTLLFEYNLSMQEVFDEFACLAAAESPKAIQIIENLGKKKLKAQIEGTYKKRANSSLDDLDANTLYNLMSELDKKEQEGHD